MFGKINGLGGTKAADKTKKTAGAGPANGPRFADMLQAAEEAETPVTGQGGGTFAPAYAPLDTEARDARQASRDMLETLEDLAADMMTATPSQKAAQLQAMVDNMPAVEGLNPEQKKLMDELATRAAATLEKLKQK